MSNSMFVPILKLPSDVEEIRSLIGDAFVYFGLPKPRVWLDGKNAKSQSLMDGFVMVEGAEKNDQCWVSISDCSPELTGDSDCAILVDVKTRSSWVSAGIVAYAFCKFAGRTVFNDACELDGKGSYTAASLEHAISECAEYNGSTNKRPTKPR
jgi:hypothetical protein